jgi:hypothetical protein
MSIVVLELPDVKSYAENRPSYCPSCKGEILQRWGGGVREIRDHQVKEALVYRIAAAGAGIPFDIIRQG